MRRSSASASSDNPSTDQYPNDTNDSVVPNVPPNPKRKKYYQTYRKKWEDEVSWLSHSCKGDGYIYCKVCNKDLPCTEEGLKAIKRHGNTDSHVQLAINLMWANKHS